MWLSLVKENLECSKKCRGDWEHTIHDQTSSLKTVDSTNKKLEFGYRINY